MKKDYEKVCPKCGKSPISILIMKWKILFFPKNMIEFVAGGDTSALENLPGMVGGC